MSPHPFAPQSLSELENFVLDSVLSQDTLSKSITLLGRLPVKNTSTQSNAEITVDPPEFKLDSLCIVRIEKSPFPVEQAESILPGWIGSLDLEQSTDIYTWFHGQFKNDPTKELSLRRRDIKVNIICPATEIHIRKYSEQQTLLVKETPELFHRIVEPHIASFPKSRTQWVTNILSGISEANKILFNSPDFIILPDMKWDLTTISALYLVAIARDETVRCLRDLRAVHVPMLKMIRSEAHKVVSKWDLPPGGVRMYIHYQPSYYHFHVHIVNACSTESRGMAVGQAHLLDDVISLLELDGDILNKMTLTYGLGDQHALYREMVAAQKDLESS